MYSFPYLEPVCCSMSSSNCCFLTCIQISQEAGQMVWYSHLLKNFPQFAVIHTVKDSGVVNKAKVDVFLELSCFFSDPVDVGSLISGTSAFSISSLYIWKFFLSSCTLLLFWITMLWTFMYKFLCGYLSSFLSSIHLGRELLSHTVTMFNSQTIFQSKGTILYSLQQHM